MNVKSRKEFYIKNLITTLDSINHQSSQPVFLCPHYLAEVYDLSDETTRKWLKLMDYPTIKIPTSHNRGSMPKNVYIGGTARHLWRDACQDILSNQKMYEELTNNLAQKEIDSVLEKTLKNEIQPADLYQKCKDKGDDIQQKINYKLLDKSLRCLYVHCSLAHSLRRDAEATACTIPAPTAPSSDKNSECTRRAFLINNSQQKKLTEAYGDTYSPLDFLDKVSSLEVFKYEFRRQRHAYEHVFYVLFCTVKAIKQLTIAKLGACQAYRYLERKSTKEIPSSVRKKMLDFFEKCNSIEWEGLHSEEMHITWASFSLAPPPGGKSNFPAGISRAYTNNFEHSRGKYLDEVWTEFTERYLSRGADAGTRRKLHGFLANNIDNAIIKYEPMDLTVQRARIRRIWQFVKNNPGAKSEDLREFFDKDDYNDGMGKPKDSTVKKAIDSLVGNSEITARKYVGAQKGRDFNVKVEEYEEDWVRYVRYSVLSAITRNRSGMNPRKMLSVDALRRLWFWIQHAICRNMSGLARDFVETFDLAGEKVMEIGGTIKNVGKRLGFAGLLYRISSIFLNNKINGLYTEQRTANKKEGNGEWDREKSKQLPPTISLHLTASLRKME